MREVNPDINARGNGVVGADDYSDSYNIEMDENIYNFIPSPNINDGDKWFQDPDVADYRIVQ